MSKLRIRSTRSLIGYERDQRRTVRALGLTRLHDVVEREDSPTIRGMLRKVRHLVQVEQVDETAGPEHE